MVDGNHTDCAISLYLFGHSIISKSEIKESDSLIAYRQLFRTRISNDTLEDIREATNKAWVLGSDCFKRKMEKRLMWPVISSSQGGDRKSAVYRRKSRSLTP